MPEDSLEARGTLYEPHISWNKSLCIAITAQGRTKRAGHVGHRLLTCGQGGDTDLTRGMHLSMLSKDLDTTCRRLTVRGYILETASSHLLNHYGLQTLPFPEQQLRLTSVGFALLQILAAQVDLEEPLNLNGEFLEELKNRRVASRVLDYEATLAAMWQSCTTVSTCDVLQTQKAHLLFQRKHINYDASNQPPAFYRLLPAQSPATPRPWIPVVVKRRAETEHPDVPPPQRSRPTPRLKRKSAFKSAGKETSEDKSVGVGLNRHRVTFADAEDNEVESEGSLYRVRAVRGLQRP
ncbi:hypothetical protein GGX14DRAFT_406067 [Mycena pura]|uniref:Uncharacterized protein n=1 Tax=Mycena pura TaxID=153505 RepID=A0AAD6USU5_9AGAR|nr:hypothetical protein GGX14DRAFT_406067 [Mycena pura]